MTSPPKFDELPLFRNFTGCAWGVWGENDQLGTVNLLTEEVIAAAANLVPKIHIKLLQLYDEGDLAEAQKLQTSLSEVDWILVRLGVAGLKAALDRYYGYGGGRSRRPLGSVQASAFEGEKDAVLKRVTDYENSL